MQYREIIAVCFHIHIKHTNTLCGQKVELMSVKPGATYIVTIWLWSVNKHCQCFDLVYVTYVRPEKVSFRPIRRKYRQNSTMVQDSLQPNLHPLPFTVIILVHQTIKTGAVQPLHNQ